MSSSWSFQQCPHTHRICHMIKSLWRRKMEISGLRPKSCTKTRQTHVKHLHNNVPLEESYIRGVEQGIAMLCYLTPWLLWVFAPQSVRWLRCFNANHVVSRAVVKVGMACSVNWALNIGGWARDMYFYVVWRDCVDDSLFLEIIENWTGTGVIAHNIPLVLVVVHE